jgi:hypothetical protein
MMHAHRAAKRAGDAERGDMRSGEETRRGARSVAGHGARV